MSTSVTITRTAKRKDGKAKGVIRKKTTVNMTGPIVQISKQRKVTTNG